MLAIASQTAMGVALATTAPLRSALTLLRLLPGVLGPINQKVRTTLAGSKEQDRADCQSKKTANGRGGWQGTGASRARIGPVWGQTDIRVPSLG
jgi:hypothetical protein